MIDAVIVLTYGEKRQPAISRLNIHKGEDQIRWSGCCVCVCVVRGGKRVEQDRGGTR